MITLYKMKGLRIDQHLFFYIFVTFILLGASSCSVSKRLDVEQVQIEGRENHLGINTLVPSFSWQIRSKGHNVLQTAYRIMVSSHPDLSKQQNILWNSGWVTTDRSEEHTSELQSRENLVCRLLLEKKKI